MKPHCPSALLPSQELRLQSDEYREEKEAELEVLTEEVIKLDHDRKELQERVDSLTLSFRHRESIHAMTEKRLQNETMRLVKEREVLQSTLSEGATATTQIDMLRTNLSNALQGNEMLAKESREAMDRHRSEIHEKNFQLEKHEMIQKSLQTENHRLRAELEDLIREREEVSSALRKSIQLAKGLNQRLHRKRSSERRPKGDWHKSRAS
jgi:chromosome segregation ATPase